MEEQTASRNWHREAIRPGEGSRWPGSNRLRNWHRKTIRLRASERVSYFAEFASRDNLLFARPNCLRNLHRKTTRSWGVIRWSTKLASWKAFAGLASR